MTFEVGGWQTEAGTDCLNDSLFGLQASPHKRSGQKKLTTSTNVQQHKSKAEKKRENLVKRAKKSKSRGSSTRNPSSHDRDPVTCDRTPVDVAAKSQQICKQVELPRTCVPKKRKPNKRNKYRVYSDLAVAAYKDDVRVAAKPLVTGSEYSREQNESTLKQTGIAGDGIVTKRQPCGDLGSNSETLKKEKNKRKVKKGTSDDHEANNCALETVTGDASSSSKKRKAREARINTETRSTGDASVGSVSMATNRKRKCAAGDVKCSTTNIVVDKTRTNSPPANEHVKSKGEASTPSAATSEKRKINCRFNIAKLKSVFQHQSPVSTYMSDGASSKGDVPRDVKESEVPSKGDENVPSKGSTSQSLRERMQQKLNSARFRYINEQLYRRSGEEAYQLFEEDPETFQVYHAGYQAQVSKWPVNPVNMALEYISSRPKTLVIADMGCGDAQLSRTLPNHVHSFDLVAVNDRVTVCDIANVPLDDSSVDVVVFCLSLMGTDFVQFLCEANRILKLGGRLLVAEVMSRFDKIGNFVRKLTKLGFSIQNKDTSNTMFVWFEFLKIGNPDREKLPKIVLMPCVYKKR